MLRSLKFLIIIPLILGATCVQDHKNDKINWVDFNTGFKQAQAEGKIAVIDCYTEWCGWCKVMDKKTFGNDTIIQRINEKYIAIKFNPELPFKYDIGLADSVTGKQLLMALSNNSPSGYPTFFFFVPQNKKMFQVPGYHDVSAFNTTLDELEQYQKSVVKTP